MIVFGSIAAFYLVTAIPANAQMAVDDVWFDFARQFRGQVGAADIVRDVSGNLYVVGAFSEFADFAPNLGTAILTNNGGVSTFVCKLNSNGRVQWVTAVGGNESDLAFANAVAADAEGNLYISGAFEGTIDFDPGERTTDLTSVGLDKDIYILKLDSDGNFLWVKAIGVNEILGRSDVAVDAAGNVYTAGNFGGFNEDTYDFDPGVDVFNLTTAGFDDIYVQKLDTNGNFVWAKAMGGPKDDQANAIAVDTLGNVYTTGNFDAPATGNFQADADFDPGPGTAILNSGGASGIFVSKLDTDGNYVWAKAFNGQQSYVHDATSIAVDSSFNVYTTGYFTDTTDFDPGDGTFNLSPTDARDIFTSKLDGNGNFVWTESMNLVDFGSVQVAGIMGSYSNGIAVDFEGNPYIAGSFDTEIAYFFGTPYVDDADAFISKWKTDGDHAWTKTLVGNGSNVGRAVAVDPSANVISIGGFFGAIDFDPGPDVVPVDSRGVYVHKLSSGRVGTVTSTLAPAEIIEGARLELTAEVVAVAYFWLRNGVPMTDGARISGVRTRTLIIDPLAVDDTSVYSCFYNNGAGGGLQRTEGFSMSVPDGGSGGGGNCLIASLAYGTPFAKELDTIRAFRDQTLLTNPVGSAFANVYYQSSPAAIARVSRFNDSAWSVAACFLLVVGSVFHAVGSRCRRRFRGRKKA
jgi:hypothetical protein